MAFLHAAMTTVQGLLAETVADWDGIFARGSLLAVKQEIDRFGAAWAGLDNAWIGRALSWLVVQWVTSFCALVVSTSKGSMQNKMFGLSAAGRSSSARFKESPSYLLQISRHS